MNVLRRVRWRELTKSECFELLAKEHLGRVAVVDDHGPVVFLVNFVLDRHMVVFRTDEGTKLDAACRGSQVAFEIDWTDTAAYTGWSVLVRGEAIEVTGPAELARLRKLLLDPWAPDPKTYPRRGRRLRREALGVIRSGPAGARDAACGCR